MSRAHKHAELIKAKADNMDLVGFYFSKSDEVWKARSYQEDVGFNGSVEYFLCLPQHKETVLNILNGGKSQVKYKDHWSDANCGNPLKWGRDWWYMHDDSESRIKPRKEKRWIIVTSGNAEIEDGTLYKSYLEANDNIYFGAAIYPVEIEV